MQRSVLGSEDEKPLRKEEALGRPNEGKTVMVTGGAGYVGSVLTTRLLESGYRVLCVDNLRWGGRSLLGVWGHPRFKLHKVDVTNANAVDEIIDNHDVFAIVHLAALVGDPACSMEPELAEKTNKRASEHLLEKAIASNVRRFIFASTCSNYGRMEDPNVLVEETSPLAPISLYAKLKVDFENLLSKGITRKDSFCPIALRFATVYGASPRMRFDLTVNEFAKDLALGRELLVYGEQFWRPYCHVTDISSAILLALAAPEEKVRHDVFNVGSTSENYTKKMLVEELMKLIPDARVKSVHKTEDPRDYRVSFEKIARTLGFTTSRTVPQGLEEIIECIRMNIVEDPDEQRYYNVPLKKGGAS